MNTETETGSHLTILLLSYGCPSPQMERYYFLEMSTLQATTLMEPGLNIVSSEIIVYTDDNVYVDDSVISSFKTIGDFNSFFTGKDYDIRDCKLKIENGMTISSHDDGEVSVMFPEGSEYNNLIGLIFEKYHLDKALIQTLKSKPGHHFLIDGQGRIQVEFPSFKDYINTMR